MKKNIGKITVICTAIFLLSGCGLFSGIKNATMDPQLSPIENIKKENERVQTPLPKPQEPKINNNSLWQPGAKAFLRDQRASEPGDILTVKIVLNDSAAINNATSHDRKSSLKTNLTKLAGAETGLGKYMPGITPASVLDTLSNPTHSGKGSIKRDETVSLEVAAMVVEILPNGNMYIKGEQEFVVNHELRNVFVSGIIKAADIEPGNIVFSNRIAQARIFYGGDGHIDSAQRQKWGASLADAISPF